MFYSNSWRLLGRSEGSCPLPRDHLPWLVDPLPNVQSPLRLHIYIYNISRSSLNIYYVGRWAFMKYALRWRFIISESESIVGLSVYFGPFCIINCRFSVRALERTIWLYTQDFSPLQVFILRIRKTGWSGGNCAAQDRESRTIRRTDFFQQSLKF